jgi:hypothetical protein
MTGVLGGLFGLAAVVALISAIPLSYRIEARSNPQRYGKRRFGYTNIWAVALNIGVASDAETQAMRRKLLVRLGIVALMFAGLAAIAVSRTAG